MGCWWETVPSLGLLFHLSPGNEDGSERFNSVEPGRHVSQYVRETHMVLWVRLGRHGEVGVCPTRRTLFHGKRKWRRGNSWWLICDDPEEVQDVVAFVCNGGQRLGGDLFHFPLFFVFSSSVSTPPPLSSSSSSSPLASFPSFALSVTEQAKIFRSSPPSEFTLRIAYFVRNGGMRTELCGVQPCCFFSAQGGWQWIEAELPWWGDRYLHPPSQNQSPCWLKPQKVCLDLTLGQRPQWTPKGIYSQRLSAQTLIEYRLAWRSWWVWRE